MLRGDSLALEDLFETWAPTILEWCKRIGGPKVVPEQAAQDVAIVVLRRVHTVRSPEAFPTWVYSVTRKVLAQHRRRAWVRRWSPGVAIEGRASARTPYTDLARQERVELVQDALNAMPHPMRELVVLCDLESRPQAEVAELMGVPLGTLKSRLRRARMIFGRLATERGLAAGGES